ncbi:uncharacterized protein LOC126681643 [Mercurialis annua]|uniref:uncharacterized protein LOC126681643 n=1 Tax=Mercurialis annua TaxID=3986 RepID=UPI0021607C59|nr:uncharacterized protein LOC126681643 [Mercurialis annua]
MEVDEIRTNFESHRKANSPCSTNNIPATHGLKLPKLVMYNGTRNATMEENFLFGLEQYFDAMGVLDDATMLSNAHTFLRDVIQLWWRKKYADKEKGLCVLNTWEQFKVELRKHFMPHNTDTEARGKLQRLKQSGTISDYIKEFTTLMLEIEDLSDKDSLFYFKDGLLDRRGVQSLDDAIAVAESLVDYASQFKSKKPNLNKNGGDRDGQKGDKARKDNEHKPSSSYKRDKQFGTRRDALKLPKPCFICDGPHWTRDSPNKKAINAMAAEF